MPTDSDNVTALLNRAADGDAEASRDVLPLVYQLLRRMAAARMAHLPPGQTLQPTALVHEAYLRISAKETLVWESRAQFLFAASRAMRNILVDAARRKASVKGGGGLRRIELDDVGLVIDTPVPDMLALDTTLQKLEVEDPEGHQVAMLRYFAGLSLPKVAEALGVSLSTIERKWRFTRAWLARELDEDDEST